jgi:hypothetical protein
VTSWAIVIGIDGYWTERAWLRGAVRDAVKMRDWLVSPAGGGVPEENLTLLTRPLPRRRRPKGSLDATKDSITLAIAELVKKSGGVGERLFFYFAGHGLTARIDFSDEPTLVAADFNDVLTDNSISLRSLWEFFETTQFGDQFLFVDACRNPWSGELVVGRWTLPGSRRPGQEPVQQFILYATSPGLRAAELPGRGQERGAFTDVLLRGLRGEADAKAWSSSDRCYAVSWETLANHVKGDFERRLLPVGEGFQIPQIVGHWGVLGRSQNPVLASFPAGAFRDEELHVYLEPEAVAPTAEVSVIDRDLGEALTVESQPSRLPVQFRLPPNTYGVRAQAPGHETAVARPPIELYGRAEVKLTLTPLDGAPAAAAQPADARRPSTRPRLGSIEASSSDPLATIEVVDNAGAVLEVGEGHVLVRKLEPAFYRVRLRTPEAEVHERTVGLAPGEKRRLSIHAPSPAQGKAVERVIKTADLPTSEDNTITISKSVGSVAAPHLSTILTIAAGLKLQGRSGANRLRALGMEGLGAALSPKAQSAVYIVFGLDARSPSWAKSRLAGIKLRLWRFGTEVPQAFAQPAPFSDVPGLGEFAHEAEVGPHWLSIGIPGGRTMVFGLACLPRRVTMLVIQQDVDRDLRVYQYSPALGRDESSDPDFLRRLELMQRAYLGSRLDLGHESAVDLLRGKVADPLAGCLGGYLLLRLGEAKGLGVAARNMTRLYPQLSDSHVLNAEYEAARGRSAAAERSTRRAIETGIPVFTEGLSRLLDALAEYRIDHPNARLLTTVFDRRIATSLWSAWMPGRLRLRALLVSHPT